MPITFKGSAEGTLIASFNGKALASTHRTKSKSTTALILLSIQGNEHCQGEYLELITNQALRLHTAVTFLIGDELQWHNLKKETDHSETIVDLKQEAIALGDQYLTNNLPYFLNAITTEYPEFDKERFILENTGKPISEQIAALNVVGCELGTSFKIMRWQEWINNPAHDFVQKQTDILAQFDIPDTALNQSLRASTNEYLKRKKKCGLSEEEVSFLKTQSTGYIKEECSAIIWIGAALRINVIAYPGRLMQVFQDTKDTFVLTQEASRAHSLSIGVEAPDAVVNQIEIKFKRKKQPQLTDVGDSQAAKTDIDTTLGISPPSVSGLIKFFNSGSNSKKTSASDPVTRRTNKDAWSVAPSKSVTESPSCFFTNQPSTGSVTKSTEEPPKEEVLEFISDINARIRNYANGLPASASKLLARALLEQSCHLLDRPSTPILIK